MKKPRINYDDTSSWLIILWFHNNEATFWECFCKVCRFWVNEWKIIFANDYESKRPHDTFKVNFRFGKRWFMKFKYKQYYSDLDVLSISNFIILPIYLLQYLLQWRIKWIVQRWIQCVIFVSIECYYKQHICRHLMRHFCKIHSYDRLD